MTSLSDLLGAPPAAVVHRVDPSVAPDDIGRVAARLGWRSVTVECTDAVDKAAVLEAFRDALHLPDWFGANYDALVDSLRDLGGEPSSAGTVLVWNRPDRFRSLHPSEFAVVVDILADRAGAVDAPRVVALVRRAKEPSG